MVQPDFSVFTALHDWFSWMQISLPHLHNKGRNLPELWKLSQNCEGIPTCLSIVKISKYNKLLNMKKVVSESSTVEHSHDEADNTLVPNQIKDTTLS